MAVGFLNVGAKGEGGSGNITLGAPATPATNDVWIAVVFSKDNVAHGFTDWNELVQTNGIGVSSHFSVWWFRYAGSTPNLTVTHTSGGPIVGGIAAFRGCDATASPVDSSGLGATNARSSTLDGDSTIEHTTITPATANTMVLMCNGHSNDTNRTPPNGWTAAFNPGSGNSITTGLGSDCSAALHYKIHASGATGELVDNHGTPASEQWVSVLIALEAKLASGTFAATEAQDVAAATGSVKWTATLAATEAQDVAAFEGTVEAAAEVTGELDATEAQDIAALAGTVEWQAVLAATEAQDVAAVAGSVKWSATMAVTEAQDVAAATGVVAWTATLDATEAQDTAAAEGTVAWTAVLAATEAQDVAAFIGEAEAPDVVTGDLAATEAQDVAAFEGGVVVAGALAATEAADVAVSEGVVEWQAVLAATEAPDVAAFEGTVADAGADVTGTLDATEAQDTAALEGSVADLVDGDEVEVTISSGFECYVVQSTSIGVRALIASTKQVYVTQSSGTPVKVTI